MDLWEQNSDWTRRSLLEHCARDRDSVTLGFFRERPGFLRKNPAIWLEDFLDFCKVQVFDCPLEPGQLGLCDLEKGWIFLNSEMQWSNKKAKDLAALRVSTLAHELGHLRLHRGEDQENTFVSFLGEKRFLHSRSFQREMEADLYAGVFLLPLLFLNEDRSVRTVQRCRRSRRPLRSATLWRHVYNTAATFGVTPTLMKKRWVDLGWVMEEPSGKAGASSHLSLNFEGDGAP